MIIYLLVELGCGQTTYENCTYFVSSGTVDAGECRLRVCQCSDNICQLRLDFDTFVLNQPDTCNFKSTYFTLSCTYISIVVGTYNENI